MCTSQLTCPRSRPPSWRNPRCSTSLTIARQSAPQLRGRSKPSWALVAAADRTIDPDLERWYATRANSHRVEVSDASHAVYVFRPKEVAARIEGAASHAR